MIATVSRLKSKHAKSNNGHTNGSHASSGHTNGAAKPAAALVKALAKQAQPCAAELELLTQKWEAAKALAKQHYAAADQMEEQLIAAVGVGGMLQLSDGRRLRVKDNFRDASGNAKVKAFTVAGIKLAEVEVK